MTEVLQKTDRWLALADACRILGVNESTLRNWADAGKVKTFRTMGGHRRFLKEDIESLLKKVNQPPAPFPTTDLSQLALARIRHRLRREGNRTEPLLEDIGGDSKTRMRLLGRELVSLASNYLGQRKRRPQFLEEARVLGNQYGREMLISSIPLGEAIKTFLFFRNSFVDAVEGSFKVTGLTLDASSGMRREILEVFDQVLIAIGEAYGAAISLQMRNRVLSS